MLAKKYNFPYETLQVLSTTYRESKRAEKPCVCKESFEYPVWNADSLVEHINTLKYRLKKELNERDPRGRLEVNRRNQLITQITKDVFKDIKISLIVEDGYKELFCFDPEGECCIDLTTLQRHNYAAAHFHQLQMFHYLDEDFNLAEICPTFWCGQWVRIKSSP